MLDKAKIAELEALLAKATPGPWRECGHDRDGCICGLIWSEPADAPVACTTFHDEEIETPAPEVVKANAALVAATINALPALLRLARAVADAPRVEASKAEVIALAGGNHWHAKVGLLGEPAKSLGGQTVILLRADAAGAGEGGAQP